MKTKAVVAVLGLAAATLALPAAAQFSMNALYAGGSIGQSKVKIDCGGFSSCDDKDTAFRLFVGYQFNQYIAAELGYADLGKAKFSVGPFNGDVKATSWDASAVGSFPVADQFAILGRLGAYHAEAKLEGDFGSGKDTKTGVLWGFGGQFDLNKNLGFRAEWNRYNKMGGDNTGGKENVDVLNIGALWRFQ
jgi:OOP family OmpA-OmpF porin